MCLKSSGTGGLRGIVVAAAITLPCLPLVAGAEEVRIGGTGNALGTMRLLGEAFARSHPESKVVVLDSIGTSGAMKAVPKGAIEIGLSSRPLTEEESRSGLTATEYARSPTVFAVQAKNGTTSISLSQIADIYSGQLASWPDGTVIRPILRQPGDDNTRQLKALSAGIERALRIAEQRPGVAFAVTDQDAADKMEIIQGGIGVTTLALIRSEKRNLRALALDGIAPTPENANSGRYPMVKRFYFVLPKGPTAGAQTFVEFVKSPKGRRILEQNGHTLP
jgi:phosphate transport system substrate-binding protein